MSKFANVISVTRLIPRLNDANLETFKQLLCHEFGCINEREFISKAFMMMHTLLDDQSTASIKNKIIEMADKQYDNTGTNDSDNKHVNAYKQMQMECLTDRLSRLPSSVIDNIGSYVNKTDSITIGCLNRQLYIESQKISYLAKRCNDKCLDISTWSLERLLWTKILPFAHTFPSKLRLSSNDGVEEESLFQPKYQKILSSNWCNSLFSRLKHLYCSNSHCLSLIPIHLFLKKYNNLLQFYKDDHIDELSITVSCKDDDIRYISDFCNRYRKFATNNQIRELKKLSLHKDTSDRECNKDIITKILMTFESNYSELVLPVEAVKISTVDELKTIIHKDLTKLHISAYAFGRGIRYGEPENMNISYKIDHNEPFDIYKGQNKLEKSTHILSFCFEKNHYNINKTRTQKKK